MPEIMDWGLAEDTRLRFVCSACFGELIRKDAPGHPRKYIVVCENGCHETGEAGYVTKKHAEYQQVQDGQNYNKARMNLREAVPWMQVKTGKTVEEINALLGF